MKDGAVKLLGVKNCSVCSVIHVLIVQHHEQTLWMPFFASDKWQQELHDTVFLASAIGGILQHSLQPNLLLAILWHNLRTWLYASRILQHSLLGPSIGRILKHKLWPWQTLVDFYNTISRIILQSLKPGTGRILQHSLWLWQMLVEFYHTISGHDKCWWNFTTVFYGLSLGGILQRSLWAWQMLVEFYNGLLWPFFKWNFTTQSLSMTNAGGILPKSLWVWPSAGRFYNSLLGPKTGGIL